MLTKFWWGAKNGVSKVHWMSWERISQEKGTVGKGF